MTDIIPMERIETKILVIRGQRVMIDADLAEIYDVTTKALNQAVKRNLERFPPQFMFSLTKEEKVELVTSCDRFNNLKHSTVLPHVFTEHGSLMLANVLKSPRAVKTSIQVVLAFTHLRQLLLSHEELARKLMSLEEKYDGQFKIVFESIKRLLLPPWQPMVSVSKTSVLPSRAFFMSAKMHLWAADLAAGSSSGRSV